MCYFTYNNAHAVEIKGTQSNSPDIMAQLCVRNWEVMVFRWALLPRASLRSMIRTASRSTMYVTVQRSTGRE